MRGLSQVSHYPREMAIRIDCNQLGKILTQTHTPPIEVVSGHLWYNSRLNFAGSISAAPLGTDQLLGRSGLAYPWSHIRLPTHPYYLHCAPLDRMTPGLS